MTNLCLQRLDTNVCAGGGWQDNSTQRKGPTADNGGPLLTHPLAYTRQEG